MIHQFDTKIAEKYGIQPAIILNNLWFWIEKNKANNKHFYDGHYWTYNSMKAFAELFSYMTERQIDYAIKKLVDAGIVIKGNYNKSSYDRTCWYAITPRGYCILQNCEMGETNLSNGNDAIVEPIPDINTYINTNNNKKEINKEKSEEKEVQKQEQEEVKVQEEVQTQNREENKYYSQEHYVIESIKKSSDREIAKKILEIMANRKNKGKPITKEVYKVIQERLNKFSKGNRDVMIEILDQSISGGYCDVFALKPSNNRYNQSNGDYGAYDLKDYEKQTAEGDNNYVDYLNHYFNKL